MAQSSRYIAMLSITLASLLACNNVDTSVLAINIAAPSNVTDCLFEADGDVFRTSTTLNTQPSPVGNPQLNLTMRARLFNGLTAEEVTVDPISGEVLDAPTRISALRFDFRWECDSNGFTINQGPFFLPAFSFREPFCLDNRDEVGDFNGFDQVAASGDAIAPQTTGLVAFQPVPSTLGLAFDEFFDLATLANACCVQVGGDCNNVNAGSGTGSCATLQARFDQISNGQLNAGVPADVLRWQPFAIYDGTADPAVSFATYPLRMRGRFDLISSAGADITSTDLIHNVEICKGCGTPTSACTF